MIPAHRLASGLDAFGQNLTRPSRSDLARFYKCDPGHLLRTNGTESDVGKLDSGCTLAVIAITGRNQNASGSDPACSRGSFFPLQHIVSSHWLRQGRQYETDCDMSRGHGYGPRCYTYFMFKTNLYENQKTRMTSSDLRSKTKTVQKNSIYWNKITTSKLSG